MQASAGVETGSEHRIISGGSGQDTHYPLELYIIVVFVVLSHAGRQDSVGHEEERSAAAHTTRTVARPPNVAYPTYFFCSSFGGSGALIL